jgi:hypothetical protein
MTHPPKPVTGKVGSIYLPRFLSGKELTRPIIITIARIVYETVRTRTEETDDEGRPIYAQQDKPILYALRAHRGIVINKTLQRNLAEIFGEETEVQSLIGKTIEIHKYKAPNKKWTIGARAAQAQPEQPSPANQPAEEPA